jgi:hypothetical protein
VEQFKRRRYNQRYHMTLEGGIMKKKNQKVFRNKKRWRFSNTRRKDIQDITFGYRTKTELVGEEIRTTKQNVDI